MREITIDDILLDVKAGSTVDIEFNQTAFFEELIAGSGSYDIIFPPTAANHKAFKYAHYIYSTSGTKIYNCKLNFSANTIINGTVILWESDLNGYKCTIEKNDFPFLVNDLFIKDLNWDIINAGPDTADVIFYAKQAANKDDDSYPVRFPMMLAPDWYKSENDNFLEVLNDFDGVTNKYRVNTISADIFNNNKFSLLPLVTFFAVLKQIAADFGYTINGNALDRYEIKNLCFNNNHALDMFGDSYAQLDSGISRTITAIAVDSSLDVLSSVYTPSKKGTHLVTVEGTKTTNSTVVFFALAYDNAGTDTIIGPIGFFDLTGDFSLNAEFYITDLLTDVYVVAYKSNGVDPDPVITSTDIRIENIGNNNLNVFNPEISIPNHLPEITVAEFLVLYKTIFCLKIDFDATKRIISVTNREKLLNNPIKTLDTLNPDTISIKYNERSGFEFSWEGGTNFDFSSTKNEGPVTYKTDLPDANDAQQYALVESESAWYKVEFNDDIKKYEWIWQESNFPNYKLGERNYESISLGANIMPMTSKFGRLMPFQQSEAFSPLFKKGKKVNEVSVVIFHGMQSDGSFSYPTASSNSYQYISGETLMGLQFEGIKGLFAERLAEWYNSQVFSDEISLDLVIKNPDISELFNSRLYYDGVLMLLKELTLSIEQKQIKPGKLVVRKISQEGV